MRRLLIFLKYPQPGRVKTRLAEAIGDEAASDVHRVCVTLTLERLDALRQDALLFVDPPAALEQTREWLGAGWAVRPQQGETLGERLIHATGEVFTSGAERVVVIGTDSPWLAPADIEEAFEALARADVVIGPAEDGGYYLIGLAEAAPALFEGIDWSTSQVCAQTLVRARALGLAVQMLRTGYDIDRPEDLQRFLQENAAVGAIQTPKSKISRV